MILLVVEAGRRKPPLVVHVVEILLVVGDLVHAQQHGRRHEQRIAPPPEQLVRIIGTDDETIHNRLGVGHAHRLLVFKVEIEIGLPERLIVCMRKAFVQQGPIRALREMQHGIVVLRIARSLRGGEQPVIKRCKGPLLVEVRLGNLNLPVADLLHRGIDGLRFNLGREICGEWTGIIRRIANVGALYR